MNTYVTFSRNYNVTRDMQRILFYEKIFSNNLWNFLTKIYASNNVKILISVVHSMEDKLYVVSIVPYLLFKNFILISS